ncbi:MAG: murein biosynthesis integral membrane protein MurJ [Sulfurospirillaceae bacterium]|nr:murein biosynthesis integral membrane protein MurJ [Sulfurospirillaceae bacterium]
MLIRSFFTNSSGILVSRIFGFIRDMLTASILGANIYSDIFFVAFKFPNLFRRVVSEGAFTQSFMPSFAKARLKSLFTISILLRFLAVIAFITLIVHLFSGFFTKLIALGFDEATIKLAAPLTAINFYYLVLIFLVTFLGSILQYKHHFATTAFSTVLLNIAMIVALLISKDMDKQSIAYALSYGVVVGGVLQLLAHILAIKSKKLCKFFATGIKLYLQNKKDIQEDKKRFYTSFFHSLVGGSTAQILSFVDTWLASFLITGSISYLYYANRIFQLPLAIFAIAVATAIFPKITRLLKNSDDINALRLMNNSFWLLAFGLCASSAGGIILSEEIIKLLFERGSFSASDTQTCAYVLSMYLVGLVPFGLAKLFSLWLYGQYRQKEAAKISIYSLVFNIFASILLMQPLGASGLALAGSLSGVLLFILTIRSFGTKAFLDILIDKKLIFLLITLVLEVAILLWLKELFHGYF